MTHLRRNVSRFFLIVLLCLLPGAGSKLHAGNRVLGQIRFVAANKAAKSSGVWIDGQYVGYLNELKGSRKILLLPGKHQIVVKQDGYLNFRRSVTLEPGQDVAIGVAMVKDPRSRYPAVWSHLKLSVEPGRAAVFVDGRFAGHAGEFSGLGRGMLLAPGRHRIEIEQPGYRRFVTTVDLLPHQKMVLKTKLLKGSIERADALIRQKRK
jgi:hypothetical protein